MSLLQLMVYTHLQAISLPKFENGYRCIKTSKRHIHISRASSTSDVGAIISNQGSIHLKSAETRELRQIIKAGNQNTLIKGGSSFQKKTKKKLNELAKELILFHKEFLWLQDHRFESLNPSICYFYSSDSKYWTSIGKSTKDTHYFAFLVEDYLDEVLSNMSGRKVPAHYELLVEAETLLNVSALSSLILSISSIETLFKNLLRSKIPNADFDYTYVSTLINTILPILDKYELIRIPETTRNSLKELNAKRNRIIHNGEVPARLLADAKKALKIAKELTALVENNLFPFKSIKVENKLREINEVCDILLDHTNNLPVEK